MAIVGHKFEPWISKIRSDE